MVYRLYRVYLRCVYIDGSPVTSIDFDEYEHESESSTTLPPVHKEWSLHPHYQERPQKALRDDETLAHRTAKVARQAQPDRR